MPNIEVPSRYAVLKDTETLLKAFKYNESTGELFWLTPTARNVKAGDLAQRKSKSGYLTKFKGLTFPTHRVIWAMLYGELPPEQIDHVNRDPYDNRKENLRSSCKYTNQQNTVKHRDSCSPYKGVTKRRKGWVARVSYLGQRVYLGQFPDPELAREACNNFREKFHGAFSNE